jgi:hypothetical protein
VGKGPNGTAAVGGASADIDLAAAQGRVQLAGPLRATAMAAAPQADFSADARFDAKAGIDVTQAHGRSTRPRHRDFHAAARVSAIDGTGTAAIEDGSQGRGLGGAAQSWLTGPNLGLDAAALADRLIAGDLWSTLAEARPVSRKPPSAVSRTSWPSSHVLGGSSTEAAPAPKRGRPFPLGP